MANGLLKPFSVQEHESFMEALERCADDDAKRGHMWREIAQILNRPIYDVKLHAHQYFLRLQAETNGITPKMLLLGPLDDGTWTKEDDMMFEQGVAAFNEGDPDRWAKIRKLLPEKTEEQVQRRYQKLIFDVSRIECGHQVTFPFKPSQNKPTEHPPAPPPLFPSMPKETDRLVNLRFSELQHASIPQPSDQCLSEQQGQSGGESAESQTKESNKLPLLSQNTDTIKLAPAQSEPGHVLALQSKRGQLSSNQHLHSDVVQAHHQNNDTLPAPSKEPPQPTAVAHCTIESAQQGKAETLADSQNTNTLPCVEDESYKAALENAESLKTEDSNMMEI